MRLNLDTSSGNVINGYSSDVVIVNQCRFNHSVIVTPDVVLDWEPSAFADLATEHFNPLHALEPELLILGTGIAQRFPHPALLRQFHDNQIGVEVMTTAAACRTYNIVMSEGRRVSAALLIERAQGA